MRRRAANSQGTSGVFKAVRLGGWGRPFFVLALVLTSVLMIPGVARASVCQQSGPADNSYTVNVCFTSPEDSASVNGGTTVSATATVTGTSPGVRRMTFFLGGEYLLTEFEAPYTFTIPSERFVDGTRTLEVEAWMRDGFISQRASISVTFANGVTTPPVNTNTFTPRTGSSPAGQPFVVAAAGDGAGGMSDETNTTNLIASWSPNVFLYLGDVYQKGTATEFYNWYRPTDSFYGRFREITNPTIGNHEYENGQAPGYFDYWDNVPHYYSYDANGWHFISLDSNPAFDQIAPGTQQYNWLVNDLNSNSRPCTVAYFHHPLYNIGDEGSSMSLADWWTLFAQKGVDLVLVAHDHTYQRWQPLDASGSPSANGVTQIVVGTGGHAIGSFVASDPRVAASATEFGAFRMILNPGGASYQFVTAGGQTLDSGSIGCNGAASDLTPPSKPAGLTAAGSYKTRIDLSWTASSDNVGVTAYEIHRDGQLLTTIGAQTSYADTTVLPGSTHTYRVRALDAASNPSELSDAATATTPTVSVLFQDGFETGDFSKWTQNNGLTVQQAEVFAGARAARGTASGTPVSVYKQLPQTETNLYYAARFKILSQSQNVNVLRFRNSLVGVNPILTLFVSSTNKIGFRNDVSGAVTTSTMSATPGKWHTVQVHAFVNGMASQTAVWLDGVSVPQLNQSGINLGQNPIGRLELGEPANGRTFDIALDEVAYDREFIPDMGPPTAATNLSATASSGLQVDLSWTEGTDDVAITGYDVYRNGNLIASNVPGSSYGDSTVAQRTAYSYRIVARDAAGNSSAESNTAFVTTGDAFADDFESGDLSKWTTVNGLSVQQSLVDGGQWAARATSDGSVGASAVAVLDAPVSQLFYRARFQLISQGSSNSASLLRFRNAANGPLASAFLSSTRKVSYRNDVTGAFVTSPQGVAAGGWHEIQMRLMVNDTASQVAIWLDGVQVIAQTDALGTSPIARLELGDPGVGRTFDVAFDNVVADPGFVEDAATPAAPSNLRATSISATQVDLAWNASNDDVGVTKYRVYRGGAPLADIDGSTLSYSDMTAGAGAQHTYNVSALDAVGHESPLSDPLVVTTSDTVKPSVPTSLAATPVAGANRIDLAWTASTDNFGVTGYRIYRNGGTTPIGTAAGSATSYSDTTVAPVTAYTYTVTALDAAGNESDPSNTAGATSADTVAPQAPSSTLALPATDTVIYVAWNAGSDNVGVTGYQVFRNGSTTPVGTVGASTRSFVDQNLLPDTAYTYTVKAVDAAGNTSAHSRTTTATTYLFYDGFEAGNLSRWTGVSGLVAQNNLGYQSAWAARATALGNQNVVRFAYKQLPSANKRVFYHVQFRILSDTKGDVDLLRLQTGAGGSVVRLSYDKKRTLGYRNDVTGQSVFSSTTLSVGTWYSAIVSVVVNGGSSRLEVWLNNSRIMNRTESLGQAAIGRIELGDRVQGHKYDVAFDNVLVGKA